MSFQLVEHILAHVDTTPARKLVLVVLARHANDDGVAWPSIETISAYTNVGDRYIRKCLRELEQEALLEVAPGGGIKGTSRRNNVYQLLIPPCICPRNARGYIDHRPIEPEPQEGEPA